MDTASEFTRLWDCRNPTSWIRQPDLPQNPPEPGESAEETLDRETREKKATKSDKAPVPIYLWEEHLQNDGPSPWTDQQKEGLSRAMKVARRCGLNWWKKTLVRCYLRWSRSKHSQDVAKAESWVKSHGPAACFNAGSNKYEWSEKGKETYRSWWVRRFKASDDHKAARDALHHGLWSSWWDWDAGSRPFFWRWPDGAQELMRDGMMLYFVSEEPRCRDKQHPE